jgi:hypothetical protein
MVPLAWRRVPPALDFDEQFHLGVGDGHAPVFLDSLDDHGGQLRSHGFRLRLAHIYFGIGLEALEHHVRSPVAFALHQERPGAGL